MLNGSLPGSIGNTQPNQGGGGWNVSTITELTLHFVIPDASIMVRGPHIGSDPPGCHSGGGDHQPANLATQSLPLTWTLLFWPLVRSA